MTDWDDITAPFAARRSFFDESGREEVAIWTGHVPVLTVALLARLYEETRDGDPLTKEQVEAIAERIVEEDYEPLRAIWEDCTEDMRGILTQLANGGLVRASDLPRDLRKDLERRGLVRSPGEQLGTTCRLMERYAKQRASASAGLALFFRDARVFQDNIGSVLELCFAQVDGADGQLKEAVGRAVRDLRSDPGDALVWFRDIRDAALDVIWKAELPDDYLPEEWTSKWQAAGDKISYLEGRLPPDRGAQCSESRRSQALSRS